MRIYYALIASLGFNTLLIGSAISQTQAIQDRQDILNQLKCIEALKDFKLKKNPNRDISRDNQYLHFFSIAYANSLRASGYEDVSKQQFTILFKQDEAPVIEKWRQNNSNLKILCGDTGARGEYLLKKYLVDFAETPSDK